MFKKKKAPPKGMRKKRTLDEDADAAGPKDATTEALMVKGVARPSTGASADTSTADDDASAVVRDGDGPFRKKAHTISSADPNRETGAYAKVGFAHESEGAEQHVYGGSATSYNEIDTAQDRDARALLEKAHKIQREGQTNDETKLYVASPY